MAGDDRALVDYLRRSYQAVDGLWFTMVEERQGFEEALEVDESVWRVLAKIQARKAREVSGHTGNGPEDLAACFGLKLTADGHEFEVRIDDRGVGFVIHACPWLALLRKSDRTDLALRIARTICPTEGRTWCAEFGGQYDFEMPVMACEGEPRCEMRFARR
jgi:hypothetical protein